MLNLSNTENQIHYVSNFQDLVCTPFDGEFNAICWSRKLRGDFSEIVSKVKLSTNIVELNQEELLELNLSEQGKLAREIILNDIKLLNTHGALPILNVIKNYEKDATNPFFSTDVYSYHVDRSPIPTDTFLCTYYGEASEILPNSQAKQKVLIPEIRNKLKQLYNESDEDFESFLREQFFDLHYQSMPNAHPINLGIGNLWRLAVDYPKSKVPPCIHRAPTEITGQPRLLLIC